MNNQRWMVHFGSFACILCCLIILTSCSTVSVGKSSGDALQVTRASDTAGNNFPPFTQTITDSTKVTDLYRTIQALQVFPHAEYVCPIDFGLEYHLTFSHSNGSEQQVIIHARGCPYAKIGTSDLRIIRQNFWPVFAQAIGISQSELFPMPFPRS